MNEILLAAARGARVQAVMDVRVTCQCVHCGGENYFSKQMWVDLVPSAELALHPDDDHFRFGTISSELRKWATDDSPTMTTDIELAARSIVMKNLPDSMAPVDIETRRMFLLILSELLASEGL